MTKKARPPLAPIIRERLLAEYGSITQAASELDTSYDRLKKAIQRNRFSENDLKMLFPERDRRELSQLYTFAPARRNSSSSKAGFQLNVLLVSGLSESDLLLIRENKVVTERVLQMIRAECERIRRVLESG